MSNWKEGYLADLIKSLEQGVSVNSIDDNNINENTPLILKTSCVSAGFFDPTESKKIHPKDLGKQKLNPIADSILISRMNTPALVGASAYVNKTYKNIFLPDRLWMAVKKHDEVCMEWLSQIISSDYYWSKIRDRATGTSPSMKNISKKDLLKLPILIPSYAEQLEISKALKTWDTAIEKVEALIDAKERQFGWLVTRLLDNKSNDQSWDQYSFRDIFSPFKEVNKSNEDLEVLSVTKDGIVSQSEYFNKEIASEDKSKYLIVRRGSLVMSGLNFWMGSIDFQDIRDVGIVSPAYKTFKINSGNFDERYLRFFVRSKYMRKILIGASVQGASVVRRNLDMDMLVNSAIHLPQIQKQKEIAELLGAAEKEINLLKKLADQYRTQKRGLMQKLLSGEWHIKNKEAA